MNRLWTVSMCVLWLTKPLFISLFWFCYLVSWIVHFAYSVICWLWLVCLTSQDASHATVSVSWKSEAESSYITYSVTPRKHIFIILRLPNCILLWSQYTFIGASIWKAYAMSQHLFTSKGVKKTERFSTGLRSGVCGGQSMSENDVMLPETLF